MTLTAELFNQSKEMNETHTRLRGHINKYIENIEGLFHIYTADGHETQKKTQFSIIQTGSGRLQSNSTENSQNTSCSSYDNLSSVLLKHGKDSKNIKHVMLP